MKKKNIKTLFILTLIILISAQTVYAAPNCSYMFGPSTDEIIKTFYTILKWAFPTLTIILSMADIFKAVTSGDEKDNKAIYRKFAIRMVIVLIVIMLPTLLRMVFEVFNMPFCFLY